MKSIYQIKLSNLHSISATKATTLLEALKILQEVFGKYNINYAIVGAFARDILLQIEEYSPKRATKDIDFAVEMESISTYKKVIDELKQKGFENISGNKFRLYYGAKNDRQKFIEFDLIPFGSLENEKDYPNWITGNNQTKPISTSGLSEALTKKILVKADEGLILPTIQLEFLVILKLIAWNDRPEMRGNDASDLALILDKYFEINLDNISENHFDLLNEYEEENIHWKTGARVMGRNLAKMLATSSSIKSKIESILQEQINLPSKSKLALAMTNEQGDYSRRLEILELILIGIKEPF